MSQSAQLLTCAEVAQILGYSVATIKRRALSGDIPAVIKLPGRTGAYLFDADVIASLRTSP